ncbi:hypothetical protein C4K05_3243 [Pseudomonas chlororaphis subsp. aureofaciens]|nr:hypothetical protein C4K05_3243 [Pseudomonas chlororaphis subsp. aureofaciens]
MLPPAQSLNGTIDKLVKAWIFLLRELPKSSSLTSLLLTVSLKMSAFVMV